MVEIDRRLSGSEFPKLVVPETRKLTNEDIKGMFGVNYRKLIEDRASALGIDEQLRFFDAPLAHKNSEAVYVAEQYVEDHLILVPVLQLNMKTSRHHHEAPMVKEVYFHIAGESFVNVGEQKLVLNHDQDMIEVSLDISHQVKTQGNPSLTLIIMEKARLVPHGRLHIEDV